VPFDARIYKIIVLAAISFIISSIIFFTAIPDLFELKAYDLFSRHLNPVKTSDDIIIITVDQRSIDAMSKDGITWPWPRQLYVPLIEYLAEADAVFMDIFFTEPSSYGRQDDQIFAESLKKASNVYMPLFLTNKKQGIKDEDLLFIKRLAVKDKITAALSFSSAITPVDILKSSIAGSGNVTIPPDKDGVYRKIPLVFQCREFTIPHFILSYLIDKAKVNVKHGSLYREDNRIPLLDEKLMLRYYRQDNPFQTFSAAEIIQSYLDSNAFRQPSVKKEYFRGKKVLIGLTAAGLYDLKPTSVSSISTGVLIHATTLDNIANNNFIRPLNDLFVILFMLCISLFISYSVLKNYSLYTNLAVFLVSLSVTIAIPAIVFRQGFYMNIVAPQLSLIISFILAAVYSYAVEGKERRFIKKTFLQYMDKNIVEYILRNPGLIKPGGQRRRVTVFFADIAGFTSMAEKMSAENTARILHAVLNSLTEVIIRNQGVIDKYIGDSIMAFWGAPIDTGKDEIYACYAAVQCMESLKEINRKFREDGLPEIAIRIGIHSGEAIVGNLGSDRLFDYTVVGDTVNIASRLESANKLFKTHIIVSAEVAQRTDNLFVMRELGLTEVKGKTVPVRVFELVAEKEKVGHDKM